MTPMLSYLVCATPRSGSTLLCHALDQTGVAGRPAEYFEALSRSGLPRRPHEYFDPDRHANIVERLAFREMPMGPPNRTRSGIRTPTTSTSRGRWSREPPPTASSGRS